MRHHIVSLTVGLALVPLVQGAAQAPAARDTAKQLPMPGGTSVPNADPFPSTYRPYGSRPTVIRNVTILTAAGPTIRNGSVVLRDGKIEAAGRDVAAPPDAVVIDGTGKYVKPGIIDTHSHIGAGGGPRDPGARLEDINGARRPRTWTVRGWDSGLPT